MAPLLFAELCHCLHTVDHLPNLFFISCRFTQNSDRRAMSLSRDGAYGIDVQAPRPSSDTSGRCCCHIWVHFVRSIWVKMWVEVWHIAWFHLLWQYFKYTVEYQLHLPMRSLNVGRLDCLSQGLTLSPTIHLHPFTLVQSIISIWSSVRCFSPMIAVSLFSSLSPSLTFLLALNWEIFFWMRVTFTDGKCSVSLASWTICLPIIANQELGISTSVTETFVVDLHWTSNWKGPANFNRFERSECRVLAKWWSSSATVPVTSPVASDRASQRFQQENPTSQLSMLDNWFLPRWLIHSRDLSAIDALLDDDHW